MFKHTVKYTGFDNVEHTEDLYFHMMVPDFADLEFNPTFDGSLSEFIKETMRSGEGEKIYTIFKMLVVNSYGRRSADMTRFDKKAEWTEQFLNSLAWEQFFLWLTDDKTGHKNAEAFWNGIFPETLRDKVVEIEGEDGRAKKSLRNMSREELEAAFLAKTSPEAKVIEGSAS
jgi:hypothetical protein